jgi:hypothetical protein
MEMTMYKQSKTELRKRRKKEVWSITVVGLTLGLISVLQLFNSKPDVCVWCLTSFVTGFLFLFIYSQKNHICWNGYGVQEKLKEILPINTPNTHTYTYRLLYGGIFELGLLKAWQLLFQIHACVIFGSFIVTWLLPRSLIPALMLCVAFFAFGGLAALAGQVYLWLKVDRKLYWSLTKAELSYELAISGISKSEIARIVETSSNWLQAD